MNKEDRARIAAHLNMYDDLVPWVEQQIETHVKVLIPSAKYTIREYYSTEIKGMIEGATVFLDINGWFDSETMEFLTQTLGAKRYRVTAHSKCRMVIALKVPISNPAKGAMTYTGMWTPKWRKDEQKNK